jgi:YHS domain-containing protein
MNMKNIVTAFGAAMLLMACNTTEKKDAPVETEAKKAPVHTAASLGYAKDPVCGMDMDKDDMIADTAQYEGKIYGFCATGCKDEFKKDPAKYISEAK